MLDRFLSCDRRLTTTAARGADTDTPPPITVVQAPQGCRRVGAQWLPASPHVSLRLLDTYGPERHGQHGAGRCIWKEVIMERTLEPIDLVDPMAAVSKRMRGRLNIWPIVNVYGWLKTW